MTERPILFNAPMVRAILDGSKTQTRRVAPIRRLRIDTQAGGMVTWGVSFAKAVKGVLSSHSGGKLTDLQARSIIASQFNPYGQPGDRLWVRETWLHIDDENDKFDGMGSQTYYRATHNNTDRETAYMKERGLRWRPSIHMPRRFSRITLEITGVRVERLQDISEEDANAEGVKHSLHLHGGRFARENFAHLWWTIHGDGSWESNPWVWVIEFRRVA